MCKVDGKSHLLDFLDWNADGIVNYNEFSKFSSAWLSRDPNDPTLPTDPNLIDPNDFTNWNPVCNLDDTGGSAYRIDLDDLVAFCAQDSWLWEACWREDYWDVWGIASGCELMLMRSMQDFVSPAQAGILTDHSAAAHLFEPEEKTVDQQILDLKEMIQFLEEIWLEEPDIQQVIAPDDWKDFMNAVYENLDELQTADIRYDWE
jgi:hypothetical protein